MRVLSKTTLDIPFFDLAPPFPASISLLSDIATQARDYDEASGGWLNGHMPNIFENGFSTDVPTQPDGSGLDPTKGRCW